MTELPLASINMFYILERLVGCKALCFHLRHHAAHVDVHTDILGLAPVAFTSLTIGLIILKLIDWNWKE
jgi:hypothetical protein